VLANIKINKEKSKNKAKTKKKQGVNEKVREERGADRK